MVHMYKVMKVTWPYNRGGGATRPHTFKLLQGVNCSTDDSLLQEAIR